MGTPVWRDLDPDDPEYTAAENDVRYENRTTQLGWQDISLWLPDEQSLHNIPHFALRHEPQTICEYGGNLPDGHHKVLFLSHFPKPLSVVVHSHASLSGCERIVAARTKLDCARRFCSAAAHCARYGESKNQLVYLSGRNIVRIARPLVDDRGVLTGLNFLLEPPNIGTPVWRDLDPNNPEYAATEKGVRYQQLPKGLTWQGFSLWLPGERLIRDETFHDSRNLPVTVCEYGGNLPDGHRKVRFLSNFPKPLSVLVHSERNLSGCEHVVAARTKLDCAHRECDAIPLFTLNPTTTSAGYLYARFRFRTMDTVQTRSGTFYYPDVRGNILALLYHSLSSNRHCPKYLPHNPGDTTSEVSQHIECVETHHCQMSLQLGDRLEVDSTRETSPSCCRTILEELVFGCRHQLVYLTGRNIRRIPRRMTGARSLQTGLNFLLEPPNMGTPVWRDLDPNDPEYTATKNDVRHVNRTTQLSSQDISLWLRDGTAIRNVPRFTRRHRPRTICEYGGNLPDGHHKVRFLSNFPKPLSVLVHSEGSLSGCEHVVAARTKLDCARRYQKRRSSLSLFVTILPGLLVLISKTELEPPSSFTGGSAGPEKRNSGSLHNWQTGRATSSSGARASSSAGSRSSFQLFAGQPKLGDNA
ncbi:hypothetical protein T265_05607 [Opisthorchis viverrini]|uniref:Uncharacterized protein n=1 Tax=Opisthorchis viverrini TaxID=6198 RepID=A0A074ZJU0_OPIVI|nr:hypothetical protein T265_05607 [Opisthorchis viverrini]KER27281.1 hypothetical protein T265_05607 [Opisthorchis viverrini]